MKNALIISVGGNTQPIIKSINKYSPDYVYFLASQSSATQIGKIVTETSISLTQIKTELVDDHQDIVSSFESSKKIINELKGKYTILIDYTGGTKSMSSGLVIAGLSEGCKFVYVGSKDSDGRKKDGIGLVKDGHEKIFQQENPYEIFAKPETDRGIQFFNSYQFPAALYNFNSALKKVKDEKRKEILINYIKLTESYYSWDKFKFSRKNRIYPELERILNNLKRLYALSGDQNPKFLEQLNKNIEFLKLRDENEKYIILDLLENAKRRMKEGKFDDSVARLYRTIEFIGQIRLKELGLVNEERLKNDKMFLVKLNELESKLSYNEVEKFKKKQNNKDLKKGILKLGLKNNYELLFKLGDKLGQKFMENDHKEGCFNGKNELSNLLEIRNKSILAHGLSHVSSENCKKLFTEVNEYAEILIHNKDILIKKVQFPKL